MNYTLASKNITKWGRKMKSKVLLVTLVLLSLIVVSATAMAAPLKKPTATITGTPTSGYAPLSVQFQYFTNWIEKSFSFIPISKYFRLNV